MKLMRESLLLLTIGVWDLLYTLHLMATHTATEGNPLMAYYLQFGVGAFVIIKLLLLFLPVFVAEWSRRYKPGFVRLMLRSAIAVYIGLYIVGFVIINVKPVVNDKDHIPGGSVRVVRQVK